MKFKAIILNSIKRLKTNNFLLFPVFLALVINQPSFSMNYFWENNSFWNNNSNTTKQEDNNQFYSQQELNSQPSELFSQECIKNKNTQNNKNKPENKTLSTFLNNCKNNMNILQSFFSPKDDILSIITYLINNEKMSIRMAAYMLTSYKIIEAIVNASKRGVIIEIILNTLDGVKTSEEQIKYLKNNGVRIFFTDNKITMHNKFIIFGVCAQ
jgi:phosphatidylserine/phosphatidylglycerophosphate/cardiolipin synthase-like enzyme